MKRFLVIYHGSVEIDAPTEEDAKEYLKLMPTTLLVDCAHLTATEIMTINFEGQEWEISND